MILVGELSLWVALLMAVWAAVVSFAGGAQERPDLIASGERGIDAAFAMVTLAALGIWTALVTRDFSIAQVAAATSANLPLAYTLAAFWAGPAGSILLWTLILSAAAVVAVRTSRERHRPRGAYAAGVLAVALALPLAALCLRANPYARLDWLPLDGRGMNPLLQSPGMMLHQPALYLGLALTAVPFARVLAALAARRLDGESLRALRRWILLSWTFLTTGIMAGMWWAYSAPEWRAGWIVDSVENAAFFPWAMYTVLLQSLAGEGARDGRLRWNTALVIATFPLAVFSAFLARGGIVSLAHSLAQSNAKGWLAVVPAVAAVAGVYLLVTRGGDPSGHEVHGGDAGSGSGRNGVGRRGDNMGPRRRSAERGLAGRIGAHIAHAGILVAALALAAQALSEEHAVDLGAGESVELRDPFGRPWRFTGQGVSQYNELNRRVLAAALDVARDAGSAAVVTSERRQYVTSRGTPAFEPVTVAGVRASPAQDVRIELLEVGDDERVRLRIGYHPLIVWVWVGGAIAALGGVISLATAARRNDG